MPITLLLGLSEFTVRIWSVMISLLGVYAAVQIVRRAVPNCPAYLTPLVFASTPIWFLHARTGFEVLSAVSLYLCFLLYMRMLDEGRVRDGVLAGGLAAATLHLYTPARGWILLSAILLLVVNLIPHLRRWKISCIAGASFLSLMVPYFVVQYRHPEIAMRRLAVLGMQDAFALGWGLLTRVYTNYLYILNPVWWFSWSATERRWFHQRHTIPYLANLPEWLAPFAVVGILFLLYQIRRIEARTLLIVPLATVFPAVLLECNNVRCMPVGIFYLLCGIVGFM